MEDKYLDGFYEIFGKDISYGNLFNTKIYSLNMRQYGYIEEIHICETNHRFSYFIVNIDRFKIRMYFEDIGKTWELVNERTDHNA